MGFPPQFLDELRDRLTLSEVVGGKVAWDRRKSNPAKGDWWAPCPFHQEKTPSFHVDDRKGFYHCFGCQASGDAITFVKETENLSFPEAVERLAQSVGLEVPRGREDPAAAAARDRRSRLAEAMERAVRAYGMAFRSAGGRGARAYAERRRLAPETLARFEIGYAPDRRDFLAAEFAASGETEIAVEAGLLKRPETGGAPYDRFRDRLIFPIRDPRGACIALGGRALGPNAQAKYINSPETPLFRKGRTLYNHGPARSAAAKFGRLVVAEGYMDVIALAAAGIEEAVAPLGTAVTEDQLRLLWKIAPEPVFALDGDAAGLRAAHKVIDTALPLLAPGRSVAFCLMPDGKDPDDLIRDQGAGAMDAALAEALPLVELLWRRETAREPLDTPERRAALKARLDAAAARIEDRDLARLYRESFARRLREHFWTLDRPATAARRGAPRRAEGPLAPTRSSALARGGAPEAARLAREGTILAIALANPEPARAHLAALEAMPVADSRLETLRAALLDALEDGADPVETARSRLGAEPADILAAAAHPHPLARPGADPERARLVLGEAIARHVAFSGREAELAEAADGLAEAEGEDWTWRIRQAGAACSLAEAGALRAEDEAAAGARRSLVAELLDAYRAEVPKKSGDSPSNR